MTKAKAKLKPTRPKPLKLTVRVTAGNIKKGCPHLYNGVACPVALAIIRALRTKGRGWEHVWTSWDEATIQKRVQGEWRQMNAEIRSADYRLLRLSRAAKPFTLKLVYRS